MLERRQPVVATLAASALDDDLTPAPKQRPPRRGSPSCTRASRRSTHTLRHYALRRHALHIRAVPTRAIPIRPRAIRPVQRL
eukprot:scaffold40399_cov67-Phaeocystis_antarctica.AAC.3